MIAKAVHHVSFPVHDLAAARRFYGGILGLEEIERPDMGRVQGVWYQAGAAQVHLIVPLQGADVGRPPGKAQPLGNHTAFAVDDYAGTLEALKRHGLDVLETRPEIGQMWVQDPSGNVIELIAARG